MMITDAPTSEEQILELARAKEREVRARTMSGWMHTGDVDIEYTNDAERISVRVGGEVFSDPRHLFPSAGTIARVTLALHAGNTCKQTFADHAAEAVVYGQYMRRKMLGEPPQHDYVWYDEAGDITAAVTRAKKKQRGLRP